MELRRTHGNLPGLLISVRGAEEASIALAGGADVVDVKEPNRGSLGAADAAVIVAVVAAVEGRTPVSAALGELDNFSTNGMGTLNKAVLDGIALVKLGLSGCRRQIDWPMRWRKTIANAAGRARPVAVVYADWQAADAPPPHEVLTEAIAFGCPALLIDTWKKNAGTLLDHWPAERLGRFVQQVHGSGIAVVLAGSLSGPSLAEAVRLAPDLIAVRGAVCDAGRGGTISPQRVHTVRETIARSWADRSQQHGHRPANTDGTSIRS